WWTSPSWTPSRAASTRSSTTSGSGRRARCRTPCPNRPGSSSRCRQSRTRSSAAGPRPKGRGPARGSSRRPSAQRMPRPFLALAYQFQWSVLWTNPYLGWLLWGVLTTLALTVAAWILATALGAFFGAARTAPSRLLRGAGTVYVEFFRNVPLLVWMFLWYFGVPEFLPTAVQDWLNRHHGEFIAAVAALGVYHGARMAEIVRAGIQSVPGTLMEAALSTGLTLVQ